MAQRSMAEMVRRQDPAILPAAATVQEACAVMRDRKIGAMLVTDRDGHLAGLFTGRDAVSRVIAEARDARKTTLGDVMTAQPDTIGPSARAIVALRMMQDGGYRHLPIVDGDRIVGIISIGDFKGLDRARLDEETGFWEVL